MIPFELTPSKWDSDFLGIPCAKLELYEDLDLDQQKLLHCLLSPFTWVTIRNPKDCTLNNIWIPKMLGAYLVDINVSFTKSPLAHLESFPKISIQNNMPFNSTIISLSQYVYLYSRFFNDPLFPQEKAHELYSSWLKNSFSKNDKYFCTLTDLKTTLGFILFHLNTDDSATIELIGVNPQVQNSGIGSQLLFALENYLLQQHILTLHVGTQIQNLQAINFYVKKGFNMSDIHYTYHVWMPTPK